MTETRNVFRLTSLDLNTINLVLAQIGDRIDALEGFRGSPVHHADLDMTGRKITNLGDAIALDDALPYGQLTPLASEIVSEIEYDLEPVIGSSSISARADHTHGSPIAPIQVGGTYINIANENPSTTLGYGTWASIGNTNCFGDLTQLIYVWKRTA